MSALRKSFIVKPKLQVKYLLITLLLTVVSSGLVYLVLSHTLFSSERFMELSTFEIEAFQHSFRFAFFWVILILLIGFGLENLIRFHRIVGPLYAIEKMAQTLSAGDFSKDFHLREGDELKDLIYEMSQMKDQLKSFVLADRGKCKQVQEQLRKLSELLGKEKASENINKEIEQIQNTLQSVTSQFKV